MDKNNELLEKQITKDFENLETVPPEDKADAVVNLAKLYEIKIKADQQAAQQKAENVERVIKIVQFGAELVVPLAFGGYWMGRGFKFEETGVFCSGVFKNFCTKFFRK